MRCQTVAHVSVDWLMRGAQELRLKSEVCEVERKEESEQKNSLGSQRHNLCKELAVTIHHSAFRLVFLRNPNL